MVQKGENTARKPDGQGKGKTAGCECWKTHCVC